MATVTQRAIAKRAQVSEATVSRVLANKQPVSAEVRARVVEAARALGGGVATGATVGLILPDAENPFFLEFAFELQQRLLAQDMTLLIGNSQNRVTHELTLLDRFKGLGASALIYMAAANSRISDSLLVDPDFPVIVVDRDIASGNLDAVVADPTSATRAACNLLVTRGHRKFAYLEGLSGTSTAMERKQIVRESLERLGISESDIQTIPGDFSQECGHRAADAILSGEHGAVSAVICANDLSALGLMQRLQECGVSIPQDISVIGFDDIKWAKAFYPALTTIRQPIGDLVDEALSILLHRIAESSSGGGRATPSMTKRVPCTLSARNSHAAANTKAHNY